MVYIYTILSAVVLLVLNGFFDIFRQSYSWWLIPVIFVGIILFCIIVQIAVLLLTILFTNVEKEQNLKAKFFRFMLKISLPIIIKTARVKIISSGEEKYPKDTRVMFVCNHQHDFDPVIIMSVFPDSELAFVGKKDIYKTMNVFMERGRNETVPDQWQTQIMLRILMKAQVIFISEMEDEIVEQMHMIPAHSIGEAIEKAKSLLGKEKVKIAAIPDGVSVIVK
jgi:hypothetical protein